MAARYLRVAPWELVTQAKAWLVWGLAAMTAERKAEEFANRTANKRPGRGRLGH